MQGIIEEIINMGSSYMITNFGDDITTRLDNNEKLLQSKLSQIADWQYEADLIKESSVNIIRGISDHVQSTDLYKMWHDFDHEKGKFKTNDEGDTKSRDRLRFIEMAYLFENGKPKDVKLKNITLYGLCWELWLTYTKGKKEFIITFPFFRNADKDNYKDLSYSIMTVDGCSYTTVFKTRLLSELKDGVSKFLNEVLKGL